jgi:hypothetical protein
VTVARCGRASELSASRRRNPPEDFSSRTFTARLRRNAPEWPGGHDDPTRRLSWRLPGSLLLATGPRRSPALARATHRCRA